MDMTPIAETLEAVIISGPRRGEIVSLSDKTPRQPGVKEIKELNRALDGFNLALQKVSTELRAALQTLKLGIKEA
jgi:hypothetical protein